MCTIMCFSADGLHESLMADLACQLLQVSCVPIKLDEILRVKSNGVPSWCEQLVKQLQMTNVIQVKYPLF